MKRENKVQIFFKIFQVSAFVLSTLVIGSFAYYFPGMPPLVRHFIVKHRINIGNQYLIKPDARFLEWFNRDPERTIPNGPNIVVSPADGFVDAIKVHQGKKHVIIEMRYSDVHVQRVPISGRVEKVEGEGKKLPKEWSVGDYTLPKMWPYQKVTTLETEIGEVVVRQITSLFANRIEVFVKEGENTQRGQRLGRILAGSTIVVEVPMNVEILVREEQNVLGGETIIGKY